MGSIEQTQSGYSAGKAMVMKGVAVLGVVGAIGSGVLIEKGLQTDPRHDLQASNGVPCAEYFSGNGMERYNGSPRGAECDQLEEDRLDDRIAGIMGVIFSLSVVAGGIGQVREMRGQGSRQELAGPRSASS